MKERSCCFPKWRMLLSAVVAAFFIWTAMPTAQAFNLTVVNNYDAKKSFAILYRDDNVGKWLCKGWYNVPAHTEKEYVFPDSTKLKYAYLYSSVDNGEGQSDAIKRTVIKESFSYYDGEKCPPGSDKKTVLFGKFNMCVNGAKLIWGEEAQGSSSDAAASDASAAQLESQAVELLNQDRKKKGLAALKVDARLSQVARAHAADMVENGYFDHTNLNGQSPFDRLDAKKIRYSYAGENIASNASVPAMEKAWMNSPKHRDNILHAKYTHVGIGICTAADGSLYGVQVFATL